MAERIIFHVDANSAFLSWSAAYRAKVLGEEVDLRDIPSVVAGDKSSRHSIILAKSVPAKKYGIKTGEPLFQALEKCPELKKRQSVILMNHQTAFDQFFVSVNFVKAKMVEIDLIQAIA